MRKRKEQKNKGITLIALVVTIIVLLILAGVTIATLAGDNGILTRATQSKEQTKLTDEQEKIKLSATEVLTKTNGKEISQDNLEEALGEYFEEGAYTVKVGTNEDKTEGYIVKITENDPNGREYFVDKNGAISEITEKDDSQIITFYINDISFECIEGETWEEWLTSNEELLRENGLEALAWLPTWGDVIGEYLGSGMVSPYLNDEADGDGIYEYTYEQIKNSHKYTWE